LPPVSIHAPRAGGDHYLKKCCHINLIPINQRERLISYPSNIQ
jgi:hypothetical protein